MGMDEQSDLNINGNVAVGDEAKVSSLLNYLMPGTQVNSREMSRLGDTGGEGIRLLKVIMGDKDTAFKITKESKKLKDLDLSIYIKADRTKSERAESDRLYKKMRKAQVDYPTNDGDSPRVVLAKGVLSLDGNEIDRYKSPQALF